MCLNPRPIKSPNGKVRYVPCGHCLQCLKTYQDAWCARLNEELKQWKEVDGHKPCIFFTLDYRPASIPNTYLIVTTSGVRISNDKPSCKIYPFWTDTTHESRSAWLRRRKKLLSLYWQYVNLSWSLQDKEASLSDRLKGYYSACHSLHLPYLYKFDTPDLPEFIVDFFRFSDGAIEHPRGDASHVIRDYSSDCSNDIFALEFHSVCYDDVKDWLKRSRRSLQYHKPHIYGQDVNPYLISEWINQDGDSMPLPSSSLTPTFKYFITSEYGPKTFRPHYHGVIFGVTYHDFKKYFVSDWNKRFGRVDFSLLRPSGGAMLYVAKYCAKGEYEHPYCKKDYFYNDAEYHSRHYEDSLLDFGLDLPLVRPTFHLMSKGIGIFYCFNKEIQNYFSVQMVQYLTSSGKVKYAALDDVKDIPSVPISELLPIGSDNVCLYSHFSIHPDASGVHISRFSDRDKRYLLSHSLIPYDAKVNQSLESLYFNKKYNRTYVTFKNSDNGCQSTLWQFGASRGIPQTRTTSISLPRYYSKILLSPLVSLFRQAFASKLAPDWHVQKSRLIQQYGFSDSSLSLLESLTHSAEISQKDSHECLRRSSEYFIRQSKF